MREHLTVVQRGQVWSTRLSGRDPTDITIMLIPEGAVLCDSLVNCDLQDFDVMTVQGGCPAVRDKAARTAKQAADADMDSDDSLSGLYMDNGPVPKQRHLTSLDCPGCGLTAKTKTQLNAHLQKFHGAERHYSCDMCENSYIMDSDLGVHVRTAHERNHYTCARCAFSAASHAKIRAHARTHSNKNLRCDKCGTGLSSKSALLEHLKRHDDQQIYPCVTCG